jgi:hypothetical protein
MSSNPARTSTSSKGGNVAEIVHPQEGGAVRLRSCPPWCSQSRHFADDDVVYADDGFHHVGPEIAIPTSDRRLRHDPQSVVKIILKAWTAPLDAEPGPCRIELQLATAEENTDMYVDLTPGEARAVATALLKTVGIAEPADQK